MTARRNGEALPAVTLHINAVARQQIQSDFNVGLRDEFADHFNHDVFLRSQGQ